MCQFEAVAQTQPIVGLKRQRCSGTSLRHDERQQLLPKLDFRPTSEQRVRITNHRFHIQDVLDIRSLMAN
jgi:hypothetical protein